MYLKKILIYTVAYYKQNNQLCKNASHHIHLNIKHTNKIYNLMHYFTIFDCMYLEACETNGSKVTKRVSRTKRKNTFTQKIKINTTNATNIKKYY